jgi:peptidyl-prolyl cis-trans isomerase SurA
MRLQYRFGFACLACATVVSHATYLLGETIVDRIVARVNADVIRASEIARPGELGERIDQLLLIQRGGDLSINVDAEISKRIAELQVRSGIVDPEAFERWFVAEAGIPFREWKAQTKDALIVNRVIGQEVASRIVIPDSAIAAWYSGHAADFVRTASVKLRETLIAPDGDSPEAWLRAEKIAANLSGAAAREGREVPLLRAEQLREDVAAAVLGRTRGEISAPVRSPDGYRVYFVEERWAEGQASLQDVRNQISEQLFREKLAPAVRLYLAKLRQDAYLQIRDGYVDSAAVPGKDTAWKGPALLLPETITKEDVKLHHRSRFGRL